MYAYRQGTLEVYVSKKRIYIRTYVRIRKFPYLQLSAVALPKSLKQLRGQLQTMALSNSGKMQKLPSFF